MEVPPKHRFTYGLHGAISQNMATFILVCHVVLALYKTWNSALELHFVNQTILSMLSYYNYDIDKMNNYKW
jgi:hypothetical protein